MITKNPIEWSWAQLGHAAHTLGSASRSLRHMQETAHSPAPAVRRIHFSDLMNALRRGFSDFGAYRSDVMFLCVAYPIIGLLMAQIAFGHTLLPLLFPLASGFALVGPIAAVGLYEMSRQREQGRPVNWASAFAVFRSPTWGAIAVLGTVLVAIFLAWLLAAWMIYQATLGPEPPLSAAAFLHDVLYTQAGHQLIMIGCGVGFLCAALAMTVSIVSFPLLLDRDVGLDTAVETSVRAVFANLPMMALWGSIVAAALVLGSLPLFLGLVIVIPVLGHATWHLYRRLVR
jgi:uncharacterized membrane protein